jgi:hypothetical protein
VLLGIEPVVAQHELGDSLDEFFGRADGLRRVAFDASFDPLDVLVEAFAVDCLGGVRERLEVDGAS